MEAPEHSHLPRSPRRVHMQTNNCFRNTLATINPHEASERHKNTFMVSSTETEAQVTKKLDMASSVRRYRAPPKAISHYLWSRTAINPKQKETMIESVDIYLEKLKASRPKRESLITPRELTYNEIPQDLNTPFVKCYAPRGPRKIVRAFNDDGYYECQQESLTPALPDLFIAREFKNFIVSNHERMPRVLEESPPPPLPITREQQRVRRPSVFADKIYAGMK